MQRSNTSVGRVNIPPREAAAVPKEQEEGEYFMAGSLVTRRTAAVPKEQAEEDSLITRFSPQQGVVLMNQSKHVLLLHRWPTDLLSHKQAKEVTPTPHNPNQTLQSSPDYPIIRSPISFVQIIINFCFFNISDFKLLFL